MSEIVHRVCPFCEATCGLAVEVEDDAIVTVRGDSNDPFSKGFICPKAYGLKQLYHDPDRLRVPPERGRVGRLCPPGAGVRESGLPRQVGRVAAPGRSCAARAAATAGASSGLSVAVVMRTAGPVCSVRPD